MPKPPAEVLLEQEQFELRAKSGGGILSYEVWGYPGGSAPVVTRYNLAYINHALFRGDNGRVLGFDNAHGQHHRHYMGKVASVAFVSFEAIQERFEQEWLAIVKTSGRKK